MNDIKKTLNRAYWLKKDIERTESNASKLEIRLDAKGVRFRDIDIQQTNNLNGQEETLYAWLSYRLMLRTQTEYLIKVLKETEDLINTLEDERLRYLLKLRYLDGAKWTEIADKMGYGLDNIYKLHKKSLQSFTV